MINTKEIFSKNLEMELKLRNISQEQLGKAIGVSQQSISEWVKGKSLPSLDTFRNLCIALRADPEIMLDLDIETEVPFAMHKLLENPIVHT